jgi:hypothetical protein
MMFGVLGTDLPPPPLLPAGVVDDELSVGGALLASDASKTNLCPGDTWANPASSWSWWRRGTYRVGVEGTIDSVSSSGSCCCCCCWWGAIDAVVAAVCCCCDDDEGGWQLLCH